MSDSGIVNNIKYWFRKSFTKPNYELPVGYAFELYDEQYFITDRKWDYNLNEGLYLCQNRDNEYEPLCYSEVKRGDKIAWLDMEPLDWS